ncbi:hypothetical protein CLOM_g15537 [Closterium sp. NIES-68]|nr:hypothetical protein CLOM_g15537 [Closterium sp. NIES-68]GJP59024.1 hypothetical protein CLOP_g7082 [Closterium sp. NIES-67]
MWMSCQSVCGRSCFSPTREGLIAVPSDLSDSSTSTSPDHDLRVASDPPTLSDLRSSFPLEPQRMQRDDSSASDALNPPHGARGEATVAVAFARDAAAAPPSADGAPSSPGPLAFRRVVEGGDAAGGRFPLDDLPDSLLSDVLRHLKPVDVLRVALVSRAFRDAAASESVWDNRLPESLSQLVPQPDPCRVSSRLAFRALCEGVHVDDGRQRLSLHPGTGSVCVCVSVALAARSMQVDIRRGGMLRDWQRMSDEPCAFFHTSVLLRPLGGYRLTSTQHGIALPRQLPAGRYAVGWRVRAQHVAPNLLFHCDSAFSLNDSSAISRRHCQPLAPTWQVLSVGDILMPSAAEQPGTTNPGAVLTAELEQLQGKGSQPPVVVDCIVLQQRTG